MRERMTAYITALQESIVTALESLDPTSPPFRREQWDRAEGGRGVSCTFSGSTSGNGNSVLEKAGVNISMIHGSLKPPAIKQMSTVHASLPLSDKPLPFFAGGISIILHTRNPNAPSVHANYRYFEVVKPGSKSEAGSGSDVVAWWFGGVTDLTPFYLFPEDVTHFHTTLKTTCDTFSPAFYPPFKKSCDDYFFIPHRGEHRGLGGIRFDDLCDEPHALLPEDKDPGFKRPRTPDELFAFIRACGDAFLPSYIPILSRRIAMPVDPDGRMRRWQLLRRGRSIEFNLVYDRGTKFGLAAEGVMVENVLVGMPEEARWEYMSDLGEDLEDGEETEEGKLVRALRCPREWA